jgi:hypothetical protein
MGASGEDLLFSPAARRVYPISVEVKNQERLGIWDALEQAEENSGEHQAVLFFKRNRTKFYAALDAEYLVELLQAHANRKTFEEHRDEVVEATKKRT